MSKKTRGPNFSSNEKEIIISLVTKYKDVVENKKTDAVTTAAKNEGWKRLTDEFNSISQYNNRSIEQLKTCWDNIKRNTRKDKAKLKKEILLTGGGRPDIPPPEPFQGQIEAILGPTLSGLTNQYDSDALFMDQNKESSFIENKIESIENNILIQPSTSMSNFIVEDNLTLVSEEESVADPLIIMASNECVNVVQEESQNIEPADGPSVTTTKEDEHLIVVPEDKDMNAWKGWSPAALKTKVSEKLTPKNESSPWLRRRRPKTSLQDKILESKLELLELMKKNVQSEAKMKNLILQEQLKQEKIKTQTLELQLKLEKQTSSQHSEN